MKYGLTVRNMESARKLLRGGDITFNQAMKNLGILYRANKNMARNNDGNAGLTGRCVIFRGLQ